MPPSAGIRRSEIPIKSRQPMTAKRLLSERLETGPGKPCLRKRCRISCILDHPRFKDAVPQHQNTMAVTSDGSGPSVMGSPDCQTSLSGERRPCHRPITSCFSNCCHQKFNTGSEGRIGPHGRQGETAKRCSFLYAGRSHQHVFRIAFT